VQHLRALRSKFASHASMHLGPLPRHSIISSKGQREILNIFINMLYLVDDALRLMVSKVWAAAARPGSVSEAFRPGIFRISDFLPKLHAYYTAQPYEVVYHTVVAFALAWLAWDSAMNRELATVGTVMQGTVLSAGQLAEGKVWTLITGIFVQPDALVAAVCGCMAVLYGTRVVTYVGPWYALKLAAGGSALSTALFLAIASTAQAMHTVTTDDKHTPNSSVGATTEVPNSEGYRASTAEGLTTAQRALNVLRHGTHSAPAERHRRPEVLGFGDVAYHFPHVGPAAAVAALASFACAAKPTAAWQIWRGLRVPVPLPAVVCAAFFVGAAASSSPVEGVSDLCHLVGGGFVGGAWLWALRSGRIPYSRFWPK
jgi:hypothetical protein